MNLWIIIVCILAVLLIFFAFWVQCKKNKTFQKIDTRPESYTLDDTKKVVLIAVVVAAYLKRTPSQFKINSVRIIRTDISPWEQISRRESMQ